MWQNCPQLDGGVGMVKRGAGPYFLLRQFIYFVLTGFPVIACFFCCRWCSAAIRAGWQGWFISAWELCALQQPSLLCSAQRPSWSTLSEASSSPGIWRKEHEMLMCRTVLVHACSEGLYFLQKISMEKDFHMSLLEALILEWQCKRLPTEYCFVF